MNDKAASQATASDEKSSAGTTGDAIGFGDGDLGRLQGILFGDHAKKTQERIDTLERGLLGALADLKTEFTQQIESLSGQLEAESETRGTAIKNVTERLAEASKSSGAEQRKLQRNLDKSFEKLTKAVDDAATDGRLELDATRRDLQALVESTEAGLTDRAVDRTALADLLASVAADLKSS